MDDNKRVIAWKSGRWEGNANLKQAMRFPTVKRPHGIAPFVSLYGVQQENY
jgi:hypothetical protein